MQVNFTETLSSAADRCELVLPPSLGDSTITVLEGGQLLISAKSDSSPRTVLNNTIHLHGGTLRGGFPSTLAGDVFVAGQTFIGDEPNDSERLTFSGRLLLEDDARVYGLTRTQARFFPGELPAIEISGQLHVGSNNVWQLATASLLVSGSIHPSAEQSSIDFQGVPSSLVLEDTEIVTEVGKSLAIMINGEPTNLPLAGENAALSGSGEFVGSVEVSGGAAVSPGDSTGELTVVGDLSFAPGAVYDWEIANAAGTPGEAWDLLDVQGELRFEATSEDPWTLRISDLPGFTPGWERSV
jgi:hypothetical protein